MTLINHSILGEGWYFINAKNRITFVSKDYKKVAKKINKRGYIELTSEQLDKHIVDFISRFIKSLNEVSIVCEDKIINNILYLWYTDGFCHYKTFFNGVVDAGTVSGNIFVNTCNKIVDKYPTIEKVSLYCFTDFDDMQIYDNDLEKLYKMYGDKIENN